MLASETPSFDIKSRKPSTSLDKLLLSTLERPEQKCSLKSVTFPKLIGSNLKSWALSKPSSYQKWFFID